MHLELVVNYKFPPSHVLPLRKRNLQLLHLIAHALHHLFHALAVHHRRLLPCLPVPQYKRQVYRVRRAPGTLAGTDLEDVEPRLFPRLRLPDLPVKLLRLVLEPRLADEVWQWPLEMRSL